jgi:hypothetical protein
MLDLAILVPVRRPHFDELSEQGCSVSATLFLEANHRYHDRANPPGVASAKMEIWIDGLSSDADSWVARINALPFEAVTLSAIRIDVRCNMV